MQCQASQKTCQPRQTSERWFFMSKILARNFLMNLVSSQCLVCQLADNETNGFYWGKVNRVVRTPGWLHTRATRDPIESEACRRVDHELQLDSQRLSLRHSHQLYVNRVLLRRRQTDRLRGSGKRMHSFIFKAKTVKYKYFLQVCVTLLIPQGHFAFSRNRPHTQTIHHSQY